MELARVSSQLAQKMSKLTFGAPVSHVYNPLVYAREVHEAYLARWGQGAKEVLLVGMNPGPFGMAQTGVPFGDVGMVRGWLGLEGHVDKPKRQHPKRLVAGLACTRSEVSGTRLWGWASHRFGTPDRFFERFFVANYCPLVFMDVGGRNLTPDKLPRGEQEPLFAACDAALRALCTELRPRWVVGVGAFAAGRARVSLAGTDIQVTTILHPSPASPLANRGWAAAAEGQLTAAGIRLD